MRVFRQRKKLLIWVMRVLGTGFFLWLILRRVRFQEIWFHVNQLSWIAYLFLVFIFLSIQFLTSYRWKLLLSMTGIKEPMYNLYMSVLYGQTINQILPSSIGGDSTRIAYLFNRHPQNKSESISSTFMDRFLGFFALLIIVLCVLPFVNFVSSLQKYLFSSILGAFLIFVVLIFLEIFDGVIERMINLHFIPKFVHHTLDNYWLVFRKYRSRKYQILFTFLLSLFTQGLTIISHYVTFLFLGIDISLIQLFVVFPVVILITALPISIGGIGVREAALNNMLEITGDEVLSFSIIRYSYFLLLPFLLFIMSIIEKVLELEDTGSE